MESMLQMANSTFGAGAAIASALIGIAVYLPKLLNTVKSDKLDGNVLDRLARAEARMDRMDETIHRQAVKLTRFEVVVLRLIALLVQHQVSIPLDIRAEIDELTLEKE